MTTTTPTPIPNTRDLPYLVPIPDVSLVLGWSDDTIRRHLVPIDEWSQLDRDEKRSKVPAVYLGRHPKVPRWWIEDVVRQVERARAEEAQARMEADSDG